MEIKFKTAEEAKLEACRMYIRQNLQGVASNFAEIVEKFILDEYQDLETNGRSSDTQHLTYKEFDGLNNCLCKIAYDSDGGEQLEVLDLQIEYPCPHHLGCPRWENEECKYINNLTGVPDYRIIASGNYKEGYTVKYENEC